MNNINTFFNMGGYALYVWTSFAFSFLAMLFLLIKSLSNNKNNARQLENLKIVLNKPREKNDNQT